MFRYGHQTSSGLLIAKMSADRSVLLVDDDEVLLEALADSIRCFTSCHVFQAKGVSELKSLGKEALQCDLAILDINLGPSLPNGLDASRWLRDSGFEGPIYFLTGHARSHPLVTEAVRMDASRVLSKPLDLDKFLAIVETGMRGTSEE